MILWDTFIESAEQSLVEGALTKAEELYLSALEEVDADGCTDHRAVQTLQGLCEVYLGQGRQGYAKPYLERLSRLVDNLTNVTPQERAQAIHRYATLHETSGDEVRAEAGWRQIIEILNQQTGSLPAIHVSTLYKLGSRLLRKGELAEGESLLRAAWDLRHDGPDAIPILKTLADLLVRKGRWSDAEAYLEPLCRTLPGDDPTLEQWRTKWARALESQGKHSQAVEVYESLLSRAGEWNDEHREMAVRAARSAFEVGKVEIGERLAVAVLSNGAKVDAAHRFALLLELQRLALLREDRASAVQFLRDAIRLYEADGEMVTELVGPEVLVQCYWSLGETEQKNHRWNEVLRLFSTALQLHLILPDPSLVETVEKVAVLAQLQIDLERWDEAEKTLRTGMQAAEKSGISQSPQGAQLFLLVGTVYRGKNRLAQGEQLVKKALGLLEGHFGVDALQLVPTLEELSKIQKGQSAKQAYKDTRRRIAGIKGEEYIDEVTPEERLEEAELLIEQGQHEQAETLLRVLLGQLEVKDAPEIILVYRKLAWFHEQRLDWAEAISLHRRAVAWLQNKGEASEWIEQSYLLSSALSHQGNYQEAEIILSQMVGVAGKLGLGDSAAMGRYMALMGEVYRFANKDRLAEPALVRAVELLSKHQTEAHPDLLEARRNLALLYRDQGNFEKAEHDLKIILASEEKTYGKGHADLAVTLSQLGEIATARGDYARAEGLFREALQLSEKGWGADHPNVAATHNNLGQILLNEGRYDEAHQHLEKALRLFDSMPGHPGSVRATANLGVIYLYQGELDRADEYLRRALAGAEEHFGPDDLEVAFCSYQLAEVMLRRSDYKGASDLSQRGLTLRLKALGKDHPETAQSLLQCALVFSKLGQPQKALEKAIMGLRVQESVLGAEHPELASAVGMLGEIYFDLNKLQEASESYERAARLLEESSAGGGELVRVLSRLCEIREKQGRVAEAATHLTRLLDLQTQAHGSEHDEVLGLWRRLARLNQLQGQWKEAELALRKVLEIITRRGGSNEGDLAAALATMAALYGIQGKATVADSLYKKAADTVAMLPDRAPLDDVLGKWERWLETNNRADEIARVQERYQPGGAATTPPARFVAPAPAPEPTPAVETPAAAPAHEVPTAVDAPVPEPALVVEPDPVPEPVLVVEPDPVPEPVVEPDPVPEPVVVVEPDPVPEPVVVVGPDPVPEPVVVVEPDLVPEPVVVVEPDPVPEPVVVVEPDPVPEPVLVVEPDPVPEPVLVVEPDPVPEPVLFVEPDPLPDPVVAVEPDPAPEPVVIVEPDPVPEPFVFVEPDPVPGPVVVVEPDPVPEPVVVVEPDPVPEPVVVVEPEPVPEPVLVAEPEPGPEPVLVAEPEPVPEPVLVVEPEPVPEPVLVVEPEPVVEPPLVAQPEEEKQFDFSLETAPVPPSSDADRHAFEPEPESLVVEAAKPATADFLALDDPFTAEKPALEEPPADSEEASLEMPATPSSEGSLELPTASFEASVFPERSMEMPRFESHQSQEAIDIPAVAPAAPQIDPEPVAPRQTLEDDPACVEQLREWAMPGAELPRAEQILSTLEDLRKSGARALPLAVSLETAASLFVALGDAEQAQAVMTEALGVREGVEGREAPATVEAYARLAEMLGAAGRHDQTEGLWLRIIDLRARSMGGEDPKVADAMAALGHTYLRLGNAQAGPLLTRALAVYRRRTPQDNATIGATLLALARATDSAGRRAEAVGYYREALQLRKLSAAQESRSLDGEDGRLYLRLGTLALQEGDLEVAHVAWSEAFQLLIGDATLAPQLGVLAEELGEALLLNGRIDDADPLLNFALETQRAVGRLSAQHEPLLSSVVKVARARAQWSAVESSGRELLALQEIAHGSLSVNLIPILVELGEASLKLGRLEQAQGYLQKSLELQETSGDSRLASTLFMLAVISSQLGDTSRAEDLIQQGLGMESTDAQVVATLIVTLERLANEDLVQSAAPRAESKFRKSLALRDQIGIQDQNGLSAALHGLGRSLNMQGRWEEAEATLRKSFELRSQLVGSENPLTADTLFDLAECYRGQRKFDAAESFFTRIADLRKRLVGVGAQDAGVALVYRALGQLKLDQRNFSGAEEYLLKARDLLAGGGPKAELALVVQLLGQVRSLQGRFGEAEQFYRQALGAVEADLGPEHQRTAEVLSLLAETVEALGNYEEAEPLARRALDLRIQTLGAGHRSVSASRMVLAQTLTRLDKIEEARELYEQALAGLWAELGEDHPDVAQCLEGLGSLETRLGRWEEAESRLQRALAIRERTVGANHPSVAESLKTLASLYEASRRYDMAERSYKRALEIRTRALGADHPQVAESLESLGRLYTIQGRYVPAEALFERALELKERVLGRDHVERASSVMGLARIYLLQNQLAQADTMAQQARRLLETAKGAESLEVAEALHILGEITRTAGRFSEARTCFEKSLTMRHKALGPNHLQVGLSLLGLGLLSQELGQYEICERFLTRAVQIFETAVGPEHPYVADSLHALGILYRATGRGANSELFLKRSMEIRSKSLGNEHPDLATSLFALAQLYLDQRNDNAAEALLKRSLEIREKVLRADHPALASIQLILARMYKSQEKYADAEPLFKRVMDQKDKVFGAQHPETASIMRELAELYQLRGQRAQAETMHRRALDILERRMGPQHPSLLPSFYLMLDLYKSAGLQSEVDKIQSRIQHIEAARES